jgi:hypothetical protein
LKYGKVATTNLRALSEWAGVILGLLKFIIGGFLREAFDGLLKYDYSILPASFTWI